MPRSTPLAVLSILTLTPSFAAIAQDISSSAPTPSTVTSPTSQPPIQNRALIVREEPRTIAQTIELATRHPVLMSTEARRAQAENNLRTARANRWFTLTGDAEVGGQHYDEDGLSGSAGVGAVGLSLNQPLLDGGLRKGAITSALERLASATENLAWQQRQQIYAAAQAHINLWLAQELVRNNADNVAQLEHTVTEVQARLSHGESTITELAEAESRLATARATQSERLAALGAAQATYLREVGEPATVVATPGEGPLEQAGVTGTHPLIASAQHQVEEAEGTYRQKRAGNWPTLDLRGRTSYNAFGGTQRDESVSQGQITLNLGYEFIDHGATRGEVAAAKAAKAQAQADLETTKLEVEANRLNADANSMEANRRLSESERAKQQTAKVINGLMEEVRQGNRTIRDLLDARRDQLSSANAWSQAYANRALSNYDLARWK